MTRCLVLGAALLLAAPAAAQTQDQPKKLSAEAIKLFQSSPEDFIKLFDKNKNGFLEKDELPPKLAPGFEKADTNGDGKLDRKEVGEWLVRIRQGFGIGTAGGRGEAEAIVTKLLEQMDADKDGKISKAEAQGRVAENFALLDLNKDGYLDRSELRAVAERILAQRKGNFPGAAGGPAGLDFDALDKNADGRLTREELKGTSLAEQFNEIDTNQDGHIDRREFEAFERKQAEKKASKKSKE